MCISPCYPTILSVNHVTTRHNYDPVSQTFKSENVNEYEVNSVGVVPNTKGADYRVMSPDELIRTMSALYNIQYTSSDNSNIKAN